MGNQNWKAFYSFLEFISEYVSRVLSVLFKVAFGILILATVLNIFYAGVEGIRFFVDNIPIVNKAVYQAIKDKVESNAPKNEIISTMISEAIVKNVGAMIILGILIALLK